MYKIRRKINLIGIWDLMWFDNKGYRICAAPVLGERYQFIKLYKKWPKKGEREKKGFVLIQVFLYSWL